MKNLNELFGQLNIWNLGAREEPLGQTGWGPCLPGALSLPMRTNAGDIRDAGSIPGSGRSPGGGNDNPLLYSCLENPMNRGDWWATVHGVVKSRMRLK